MIENNEHRAATLYTKYLGSQWYIEHLARNKSAAKTYRHTIKKNVLVKEKLTLR
ncbi:MAG: hypothetical protein ACUVQP_09840 [Bacteroidales bacterium]